MWLSRLIGSPTNHRSSSHPRGAQRISLIASYFCLSGFYSRSLPLRDRRAIRHTTSSTRVVLKMPTTSRVPIRTIIFVRQQRERSLARGSLLPLIKHTFIYFHSAAAIVPLWLQIFHCDKELSRSFHLSLTIRNGESIQRVRPKLHPSCPWKIVARFRKNDFGAGTSNSGVGFARR